MNKKIFLLIFFALTSCAAPKPMFIPTKALERTAPSENIFISLPEKASYEGTVYDDSGIILRNCIYDKMKFISKNISTSKVVEQEKDSLKSAKSFGAKIMIFPTILHWEDRATAWSGRPDKISLRMSLYDVETGELLSEEIIQAESSVEQFVSSEVPELMNSPLSDILGRWFGFGPIGSNVKCGRSNLE